MSRFESATWRPATPGKQSRQSVDQSADRSACSVSERLFAHHLCVLTTFSYSKNEEFNGTQTVNAAPRVPPWEDVFRDSLCLPPPQHLWCPERDAPGVCGGRRRAQETRVARRAGGGAVLRVCPGERRQCPPGTAGGGWGEWVGPEPCCPCLRFACAVKNKINTMVWFRERCARFVPSRRLPGRNLHLDGSVTFGGVPVQAGVRCVPPRR